MDNKKYLYLFFKYRIRSIDGYFYFTFFKIVCSQTIEYMNLMQPILLYNFELSFIILESTYIWFH